MNWIVWTVIGIVCLLKLIDSLMGSANECLGQDDDFHYCACPDCTRALKYRKNSHRMPPSPCG